MVKRLFKKIINFALYLIRVLEFISKAAIRTYRMTPNIKKILVLASLALVIATLSGCGSKDSKSTTAQAAPKNDIPIDTALQARVQKFATKPRCKGNFGLYVYDLTADKPVYGNNEHQPQPSASCMKLLSGVAGLHLLGTGYLYHSYVYTNGTQKGDTLVGDLGFKGDLDPQLTAEDVNYMIGRFKKGGIKAITGKFYIDVLMHEAVKAEAHWYPFDLTLSKYSILYRGDDFIKRTIKNALRQNGISVKDDQIVFAPLPKSSRAIFRLNRHINLVIQRMWKNSANTQATSLLYTIGHVTNPKTNDLATAGVQYMQKFIKEELKSNEKGIVLHDGCGLCTQDQLTPYFLCEILRYGYAHKPIYNMLNQFLAISGEDGTLRRWPAKIKGKVHAKTGTLSHPYGISSLAGYVQAANGHLLCFAIMDSDMSVLDAHVLQQDLCEILAEE